jgi:hypothetical protein
MSKSYEKGEENNTVFLQAKKTALEANAYAQLTDYIKAEAEVQGPYAEVDTKAGWTDGYHGVEISAGVGLAAVEASMVLGSDAVNLTGEVEAKFCCADGAAAFKFEEDGQFTIGVKGSATLADASASLKFSLLNYKIEDTATGEKDSLLCVSVSPKGGISAAGGVWMESKTALEGEYFNINATTLSIDAEALVGGEVSITVPTIAFRTPW